jgi:hypothetical protein
MYSYTVCATISPLHARFPYLGISSVSSLLEILLRLCIFFRRHMRPMVGDQQQCVVSHDSISNDSVKQQIIAV